MQVVIMAAGSGSRMRPLTKDRHKSLLPLDTNDTFLSRMLHQLNEYEIDKVIIVTGYRHQDIEKVVKLYELNITTIYNEKYAVDTNIYSMKLALDTVDTNSPVIILEADIYLDDYALYKIIKESRENKSLWFTKGSFTKEQYGGILKKDTKSNILDIAIVPQYKNKYEEYDKLLGIMTIGTQEIEKYKTYLNLWVEKTLEQYYLIPWIENLQDLPCIAFDLDGHLVESVNREEEYYSFLEKLKNSSEINQGIKLVALDNLLDIEEHIPQRKEALKEKILQENIWTKPIIIEKNHNLVLDGHHRFNLAKELGIKKLPAVAVDYNDIQIWSLKESQKVTKELVIQKAKAKNIYPNKTVKHYFNFKSIECRYTLEELS